MTRQHPGREGRRIAGQSQGYPGPTYAQGPAQQPPQQPPQRPPQQQPQQRPPQQPQPQQPPPQGQATDQSVQPQAVQPTQPFQGGPQPQGTPTAEPGPAQGAPVPIPAIDVFETDEAVVVLVDLPGCEEDDIRIRAENDQLTVAAERRDDLAEGATTLQRERPTSFQRTVAIPTEADVEGANAAYDAGVCTVTFPTSERRRTREIGFQ